jgi:hypothetical protein
MIGRRMLCTQCGAETDQATKTMRGSAMVNAVLFLCFGVPGIVYWVWRMTTKFDACPTCGHAALIPANAPLARAWLREIAQRRARPLELEMDGGDVRLERIEQAIDAMAVEVERIGEGQRVTSRMLDARSQSSGGDSRSNDRVVRTPTS